MNKLPLEKRVQILNMLVEGSSMRSIERVVGVSINTVTKMLVEAGQAAEAFHDRTVRGLKTSNFQADEIWSFCYAKRANVAKAKKEVLDAGDIWTFTGLDRDSKMIVTWLAGDRSTVMAEVFLADAKSRIDTPVQITTDGWVGYEKAIAKIFSDGDTSYAQQVKQFAAPSASGSAAERRYSPGQCISCEREVKFGNPDMKAVSTSHVERQNLTMRMSMRRFTRLTNAFSKKFDNHCYALALYFFHYNFCRQHKSLRVSPAMAAGITDELLDMTHLCKLMDEANPPKKRGPYKKAV